jgi:VWFA-related protein
MKQYGTVGVNVCWRLRMGRAMLRSVGLVAVLAAGWMSAAGQVAPPPADGSSPDQALQVNARLVVLDVVVVDANGNFVPNLDRSKFHVTEDKDPQVIRNFDPPSGHAMPGGSAGKIVVNSSADLPKIGNAPVNILVVDELNTPYMQIAYTQQMMERYLKRQPEVLPLPTLLIAAGATHIAVLHDFTQNRADLIKSIHQHVTETDFTQMMAYLNGGHKGNSNNMALTLGALLQIATSMQGFPGRKNVIWVGSGYNRSAGSATADSESSSRVMTAIRTVTNRMLAAHITLYSIDPAGVYSPMVGGSSIDQEATGGFGGEGESGMEPSRAFNTFAYATGGRVITGRNDVDVQIGKTEDEGALYYTLAYEPSHQDDAARHAYRRIHVTLDDPTLRVVTRNGYFNNRDRVAVVADNTVKKQPRELVVDLMNAARTEMVYTGLHSDAQPSKDGFVVRVQASDLSWQTQGDGSRIAEVTVVGVCFDKKGKELGQHSAELKQQIEVADDIGNGAKVGFAFPFEVAPKTARVRLVLRDAATGTMGSANVTP